MSHHSTRYPLVQVKLDLYDYGSLPLLVLLTIDHQ